MQFEYTPYILPLLLAGVSSVWVAYYARSHRSVLGASALTFLALAAGIWTIGYALEIAGADLETKVLWSKVQYVGVTTVPLLWLIFCYNYFNQNRQLPQRVIVALGIVPLITFLLVLTTESHGWIWSEYHVSRTGDFSGLKVTHGFWFNIFWVYSQLLVLAGIYFILRLISHKHGLYRGQIVALLGAAAVPLVGNLLYIFHLTPVPDLDPTSFGFAVAAVFMAWGIFRFQLMNLVPLARDTLVDAMEAGMIVIDAQRRVADINRAALTMIGRTIGQVIHQPAAEVLSRWPHLIKKYASVIEALDEIAIGEGEQQRWFELGLSPLRNNDGTVIGRLITLRDITEQRRMREQSQIQNKYLSILHEITLDLLNRRELNDLLQAIANHAADLLNAPYGEIMLKEGDELVVYSFTQNQNYLSGDRVGRDTAKLAWQAHDTGQPAVLDDYSAWSDHRAIYDQVHLTAVADFPVMVEGKCVAVIGMGRSEPGQVFTPEEVQTGILFSRLVGLVLDSANLYASAMREVAERKMTEFLLQESETRYRQIVENADELISRTTVEGVITYVNPTSLWLFGMKKTADILGRNYLEFVIPKWRAKVRRFYLRQFLSVEPKTYLEFPVLTADGHERWLGQNVQIIREANQIVGFQAVARDITAIKRAQEALSLARDQAQEASHFKGDLLARVSHELRTPLAGVLGYAELLRDQAFGPLSTDQMQAVETIAESSEYLSTVISDLMDQAQIEAKKLVLHFGECSPSELLQHLEEMMAVLAQKRGLTLRTILEPDVPGRVESDEQRLRQILINLVANAIKFTKQGEVRVRIFRPDPTHWAMQVSDTGVGVPEEAQATIFEPFQKVKSALTRDNRGIGLGLSITKQLIDLMDGQIVLTSQVGKGSTFLVTLPIHKTGR